MFVVASRLRAAGDQRVEDDQGAPVLPGDRLAQQRVGGQRGRPAFLAERYDPAHVELVGLYDAADGDVGM
ncbi:GNAT family N-acetyltransferase, partial [Micromonospora purpureochromogenes]